MADSNRRPLACQARAEPPPRVQIAGVEISPWLSACRSRTWCVAVIECLFECPQGELGPGLLAHHSARVAGRNSISPGMALLSPKAMARVLFFQLLYTIWFCRPR
jgi:hypothetical protein